MGLARWDVKEQSGMGECAEFFHGTTELGNYRAGSEGPFSSGGRHRFTGRQASSGPAFTGTQTWEAPLSGTHVWDEGDPGGKPGAFFVGTRRCFSGLGVRTMARTAMSWVGYGSYGSSVPNYRDLPVPVSPWAQRPTGRAATEPHHGGAALRSLMAGHGSSERTDVERMDLEMRRIRLRAQGCWRRIP